MKKLIAVSVFAVLSFGGAASAQENVLQILNDAQVQNALLEVTPFDLINWKVGDTMQYSVSIASFGINGTMVKAVTKDEGTSIWVNQDLDLQIQKQNIQTQINKADGKILKMIVNGQEQAVPDDKIEIISQDYTDITVKAGSFKAMHIVAKSPQVTKLEAWINPKDTLMDGAIKEIVQAQGMEVVLELTSFKHGQ
jgi:hypothetical protein